MVNTADVFVAQLDKVEADLNRSKQLREKQAKEFDKKLLEERCKHQQQVTSCYDKLLV